jgi:hypothetical protein
MATFADLPAELVARVCRAVFAGGGETRFQTYATLLTIPRLGAVATDALNAFCASHCEIASSVFSEYQFKSGNVLYNCCGFNLRDEAESQRTVAWVLDIVCCCASGPGVCVAFKICSYLADRLDFDPDGIRHSSSLISQLWYQEHVEAVLFFEQIPHTLLEWVCERFLESSHTLDNVWTVAPLALVKSLRPVVVPVFERTLRTLVARRGVRALQENTNNNVERYRVLSLIAAIVFRRPEFVRTKTEGFSDLTRASMTAAEEALLHVEHTRARRAAASRASKTTRQLTLDVSLVPVASDDLPRYRPEDYDFPYWISKASQKRYVHFIQRLFV